MSEPIRPEKVEKKPNIPDIPDFVIDAFNELIENKWDGNYVRINQDEAIEAIMKHARKARKKITRSGIFSKHWLDVEDLYRSYGWKVEFNKQPYYVMDDDDFFIFKK